MEVVRDNALVLIATPVQEEGGLVAAANAHTQRAGRCGGRRLPAVAASCLVGIGNAADLQRLRRRRACRQRLQRRGKQEKDAEYAEYRPGDPVRVHVGICSARDPPHGRGGLPPVRPISIPWRQQDGIRVVPRGVGRAQCAATAWLLGGYWAAIGWLSGASGRNPLAVHVDRRMALVHEHGIHAPEPSCAAGTIPVSKA
ncbi:hypothetical protein D9M70_386450 [compost metagenome]